MWIACCLGMVRDSGLSSSCSTMCLDAVVLPLLVTPMGPFATGPEQMICHWSANHCLRLLR